MASFLDNVVAGISQGINSVSEGSKNFVGKAKMNTQIQNLEREKNVIFQNIGALVYNLQTKGEVNIEQIGAMCEQIGALNNQIESLNSQIRMLEAQKAPAQPAGAVSGIQCECGAINRPEAKFCSKCGRPINAQ